MPHLAMSSNAFAFISAEILKLLNSTVPVGLMIYLFYESTVRHTGGAVTTVSSQQLSSHGFASAVQCGVCIARL